MTYDSSYILTGKDVPEDDYDRNTDLEEEYEPKPAELGRIKLKNKRIKRTEQERHDRERLEWLRNLREE